MTGDILNGVITLLVCLYLVCISVSGQSILGIYMFDIDILFSVSYFYSGLVAFIVAWDLVVFRVISEDKVHKLESFNNYRISQCRTCQAGTSRSRIHPNFRWDPQMPKMFKGRGKFPNAEKSTVAE